MRTRKLVVLAAPLECHPIHMASHEQGQEKKGRGWKVVRGRSYYLRLAKPCTGYLGR